MRTIVFSLTSITAVAGVSAIFVLQSREHTRQMAQLQTELKEARQIASEDGPPSTTGPRDGLNISAFADAVAKRLALHRAIASGNAVPADDESERKPVGAQAPRPQTPETLAAVQKAQILVSKILHGSVLTGSMAREMRLLRLESKDPESFEPLVSQLVVAVNRGELRPEDATTLQEF